MKLFSRSLRFVASTLFHRFRIDREMDEELRSHIQHRADHLERSGISRAEAERRARIEFGGFERFKEECREAVGLEFFESSLRTCVSPSRMHAQDPGFTAHRRRHPGLRHRRQRRRLQRPERVGPASPRCARARKPLHGRTGSSIISSPIPITSTCATETAPSRAWLPSPLPPLGWTPANPSPAWLYEATGNYFDALGIQPYLGRFFHGSDERGPEQRARTSCSATPTGTTISRATAAWSAARPTEQVSVYGPRRGAAAVPRHSAVLRPDLWVPLVNQEQIEGESS